jgi:hypothetical protein
MYECLFNRYDHDGLDGNDKTYSFMQLTRKCKCEACKEFAIMWDKMKRKDKKQARKPLDIKTFKQKRLIE